MAYSKYSSDRAPGREHIPLYPKGFIGIRFVQLIIAIFIAGLCAYAIRGFVFDGAVLILAVAIATLTTSTYHLITRFSVATGPKAYNYWAVLALDLLLLVLWLASFALLTSLIIWYMTFWTAEPYNVPIAGPYQDDVASDSSVGGDPYEEYDPYAPSSALEKRTGSSLSYDGSGYGFNEYDIEGRLVATSCFIAAAGLGAIEFILHLISLIIHSVFVHRHRAAGLHSKPVKSSSSSHSGRGRSSGRGRDNSNTALFSSVPGVAPATPCGAAVIPNINEKAYHYQPVDSTPIPVPHNQNQNHHPQVPSPAPTYYNTLVSSHQQQHQHQQQQQPYIQQQPYLSPQQTSNHQHQQQQKQQRQYQTYQAPHLDVQGQGSVHSLISPQTTGRTNYTQFQAVSPVPTPPVTTHRGHVPAGVYQLP